MKLSRRSILALAGAGAVQAVAQTTSQTAAPNPDPVAKAREDNAHGAEVLTKFEIPMSAEPAFTFRP